MTPQRPNWHELAAQTSKELDPVRLMRLVDELNRALEKNEQTHMRLQTQKFA
jgi:hypothetical protein